VAKLTDLADHFDGDLWLPVRGKTYKIPEPTATEVDRIRGFLFDAAATPAQEIDEAVKILGPVYEQAIADGLGWAHVRHMGRTALYHYGVHEKVAAQFWRLGHIAALVDLDTLLAKE
jgi:hypothetical protein